MQKLPNLDLMRSFAVSLVLLDHILQAIDHPRIGPWDAGWMGSAGVYLFFVHTCLVLMWSLERHSTALGFYVRRAFRIYPLAISTLLATIALRLPLMPFAHAGFQFHPPGFRAMVANLLLIQNVYDGHTIIGVYWSLPLELQMYLVLPPLFLVVRRFQRLWPLLALWGFVCFLDRYIPGENDHITIMCVPCFLPGIMGYLLFSKIRPSLPGWLFPAFLAVSLSAFLFYPGIRIGWLLCLAAGLGLPLFRQLPDGWLTRIAHQVAEHSYSIYLMHLIAIYVGILVWGRFGLFGGITAALLTGMGLTVLAHRVIEKPGMRLGARISNWIEARRTLAGVPAVSV